MILSAEKIPSSRFLTVRKQNPSITDIDTTTPTSTTHNKPLPASSMTSAATVSSISSMRISDMSLLDRTQQAIKLVTLGAEQ